MHIIYYAFALSIVTRTQIPHAQDQKRAARLGIILQLGHLPHARPFSSSFSFDVHIQVTHTHIHTNHAAKAHMHNNSNIRRPLALNAGYDCDTLIWEHILKSAASRAVQPPVLLASQAEVEKLGVGGTVGVVRELRLLKKFNKNKDDLYLLDPPPVSLSLYRFLSSLFSLSLSPSLPPSLSLPLSLSLSLVFSFF